VKALAGLSAALALVVSPADAAKLSLPSVPHYEIPSPLPDIVPPKPPNSIKFSGQDKASKDNADNQETNALIAWSDKYVHLFSIIGSLSFLVAALSFTSSAVSARKSVKAHDFKTVSDITTAINSAWIKFNDASTDKRKDRAAELFNEYERACFFINHRVVGSTGRAALGEAICDGILIILRNETLSSLMIELRDEETVFEEMRVFCCKYPGPSKNDPLFVSFTGQIRRPVRAALGY